MQASAFSRNLMAERLEDHGLHFRPRGCPLAELSWSMLPPYSTGWFSFLGRGGSPDKTAAGGNWADREMAFRGTTSGRGHHRTKCGPRLSLSSTVHSAAFVMSGTSMSGWLL